MLCAITHYWFLDTHFAVSFGVEIDDVVSSVVVPAVHEHRMKNVVGWVLGVCLLEELIQGQLLREFKPVEVGRRRGEDFYFVCFT